MNIKYLVSIIIVAILAVSFFYLLPWYFPNKISSIAIDKFYEWKKTYGEDSAREMTVTWLKQRLLVKDAGLSGKYDIWVKYWFWFTPEEVISTAPLGPWKVPRPSK